MNHPKNWKNDNRQDVICNDLELFDAIHVALKMENSAETSAVRSRLILKIANYIGKVDEWNNITVQDRFTTDHFKCLTSHHNRKHYQILLDDQYLVNLLDTPDLRNAAHAIESQNLEEALNGILSTQDKESTIKKIRPGSFF